MTEKLLVFKSQLGLTIEELKRLNIDYKIISKEKDFIILEIDKSLGDVRE
jgi:hypothetical protein